MKLKTTKQFIKQHSAKIFACGYCDLQYLFGNLDPFAYSAGVYGWACDYYDLGGGVILSTGYSPIGERVDYKTLREYEKKAEKIANDYDMPHEQRTLRIKHLREKFIVWLKANNQ